MDQEPYPMPQATQTPTISKRDLTLESFKVVPGTEKAFAAIVELLEENGRPMALIYGPPGTGKSHLLEAYVNAMRRKGIRCMLLTWPRIIRSLELAKECDRRRNNDGKPWVPFEQKLTQYCMMPYLIVDDVGMGLSSTGYKADDAWGYLEEIMNERYYQNTHGGRLVTLMATNLNIKPINDLPFIPPRIESRFGDREVSMLVLNNAKDYRRSKKKS